LEEKIKKISRDKQERAGGMEAIIAVVKFELTFIVIN